MAPTAELLLVRDRVLFVYPETVALLDWQLKEGQITILFAKNPARAKILARKFRNAARRYGVSLAEGQRLIGLKGNVVIAPNTLSVLTPARRSLIVRCLR